MSRKTKQNVLPPRPDRRIVANGAGISTWNEYLRDLEKWADAAEKRIKELEQNLFKKRHELIGTRLLSNGKVRRRGNE